MTALTAGDLEGLLKPYLPVPGEEAPPPQLFFKLADYLELILKWNARMNLTAIREPEEIVSRHFGESLFAARQLGECETLLDFGSGAGFPGVPMQLWRADIAVTLAESQGKKASFLREVVRQLGLRSEVWAGRVEEMPADRIFDVVALRAVDRMSAMLGGAGARAGGGRVFILGVDEERTQYESQLPAFQFQEPIKMPRTSSAAIFVAEGIVPRGALLNS